MSERTGERPAAPGAASDFKFTQNADECKTLKSMMESGDVTPSTRPQDVKATREEFQKIKGDKFRAQFDKLKNAFGIGTRQGKHCLGASFSASLDITLNPRISSFEVVQKEKELMDTLREEKPASKGKTEEDDEEETEVKPKERCNWMPQHLQGTCEDAVGVQHAALIVALTGGVASSDSSKIEVTSTNNGYSILASEEWCDEMVDMDLQFSARTLTNAKTRQMVTCA